MKKLWLAAVGLLALGMGAPASAADLAARPYAPVVAIYNWSGFYIGINGGGGSAHKCWDFLADSEDDPPGPEGCHDATGGTIGGQIGYRWQSANWVFGVEGQGNWADFTGSNVSFLFAPDFNRSKIDSFGLITGQVGYAWNNVLFYVKGGVAATGDTYEAFSGRTGALLASANETRWGGTVGVGLEYGFAPNWSVGAEYDHLFMGSRDVTLAAPFFFQIEHIQQDVDIGLVRLNYRFNGFGGFGAPFAARY
jgi:outer membrane immunogenic protein